MKEYSVDNLWEQWKGIPKFNIYFNTNNKKTPSKDYFFAVLSTIAPHTAKQIFEFVKGKRKNEEEEERKILIDKELLDLINKTDVTNIKKNDNIEKFIYANRKYRKKKVWKEEKWKGPIVFKDEMMDLEQSP